MQQTEEGTVENTQKQMWIGGFITTFQCISVCIDKLVRVALEHFYSDTQQQAQNSYLKEKRNSLTGQMHEIKVHCKE